MILPPRTLFLRLTLWSALLVWAIWKLRQHTVSDIFGGPPPVAPVAMAIPRPGPAPAAPAEVPDIVDLEAAMRAMDAAASAATGCGVTGKLAITLGEAGLAEATITPGTDKQACLATAVWGAAWPATRGAFALERELP